jgi:hypothetical protein
MMSKLFFILFFTFFMTSCSKDNVIWSKGEVLDIARENDPTFSIVVPKYIHAYVVNCADYRPICVSGHKVKVRTLEMILLEYKSHELAVKAAKSFGGYVKNNWAFDSVQDEPILERFIKENYGAFIPK